MKWRINFNKVSQRKIFIMFKVSNLILKVAKSHNTKVTPNINRHI